MTPGVLLILASSFSLIIFAGIPAVGRRMRELEASSSDYKYWAFGFTAIGLFAIWSGQMSVIVSMPTIANHFSTDLPTIQWTHSGYILTMSALILPMGRLAEHVGRKRVYIVGSLVFVLASLLAVRSHSLIMLLLSRVVQGIGGAMTEGPGMAILASGFPSNERCLLYTSDAADE